MKKNHKKTLFLFLVMVHPVALPNNSTVGEIFEDLQLQKNQFCALWKEDVSSNKSPDYLRDWLVLSLTKSQDKCKAFVEKARNEQKLFQWDGGGRRSDLNLNTPDFICRNLGRADLATMLTVGISDHNSFQENLKDVDARIKTLNTDHINSKDPKECSEFASKQAILLVTDPNFETRADGALSWAEWFRSAATYVRGETPPKGQHNLASDVAILPSVIGRSVLAFGLVVGGWMAARKIYQWWYPKVAAYLPQSARPDSEMSGDEQEKLKALIQEMPKLSASSGHTPAPKAPAQDPEVSSMKAEEGTSLLGKASLADSRNDPMLGHKSTPLKEHHYEPAARKKTDVSKKVGKPISPARSHLLTQASKKVRKKPTSI